MIITNPGLLSFVGGFILSNLIFISLYWKVDDTPAKSTEGTPAKKKFLVPRTTLKKVA